MNRVVNCLAKATLLVEELEELLELEPERDELEEELLLKELLEEEELELLLELEE